MKRTRHHMGLGEPSVPFQTMELIPKDQKPLKESTISSEHDDTVERSYNKWPTTRNVLPPSIFEYMRTTAGSDCSSDDIYNWLDLFKDPDVCAAIATETVGMAGLSLWATYRLGRLGSSVFHEIYNYGHRPSLAKKLYSAAYTGNSKNMPAALAWGKECEKKAFVKYTQAQTHSHVNFASAQTGVHICSINPMICASPDGLITCACCGDGVLEIKSPYLARNCHPLEGEKCYRYSKDYMLNTVGDLKRGHPYHYQIQGQLAILQREYCDLCVYTNEGIHVTRVYRDRNFWDKLEVELVKYYKEKFVAYFLQQYMLV